MSFRENVESLQNEFRHNGYSIINEPYDISILDKEKVVDGCEIIARKDFFNIIYMQVKSNWRGIATEVAKKSENSCLVITRYGDSHTILSTMKDHSTLHPKPRYVVLDTGSKPQLLKDFIKSAKVKSDDDYVSVDEKVKDSFDKFFTYQQAIDEFAENLEKAIKNTRTIIDKSSKDSKDYDVEAAKFLDMCRKVISDKIEPNDIKEMLLQHVLTYRIFALIYDEHKLHTTNAVARSLEGLINILGMDVKEINANYSTIDLVAESITVATEKQDFLKQVYETFYAKYDPKNKDSWGIAYTPSEVVDFMVKSTEQLLEKHFGKSLSDDNVTILDPATGTGTFVTSVLRHTKPASLESKYNNDIFANDISILAYYIAALNIENTYQEITGKIKEFENICWMDTLTSGTKDFGKLSSYFDGQDNVKRISRQQAKDICVVLGNPPYNALQVSFNDANPADKYPDIDQKIEETWSNTNVKKGSTKYDMYKRFLKWSSERIKKNGMVVFISNNSFLDAKSDDGFRRAVYDEFDYIYTVNLKGNQNVTNWRKQGGKVFGSKAKIGITISFFIKTGEKVSKIYYTQVDDGMKREEKLKWLADNSLSTLSSREIMPDKEANWLNQTNNDFDELVPVVNDVNSVFKTLSYGSQSNRDEWVYDFDKKRLENKIKYFFTFYNRQIATYENTTKSVKEIGKEIDKTIKWTSDTLNHLLRGNRLSYTKTNIQKTMYRPFVVKYQYFDKIITHRQRKFPQIFQDSKPNMLIGFPNPKTNIPFHTLVADKIMDTGSVLDTQCIPLYMYGDDNKRYSNITEFGLKLFQTYYKSSKITYEDIFYYTYAIFNDPKYSEKYMFNLQRKFPRMPLAENFMEWVGIGKKLYDLHVGFESAKPYPLKLIDKKTNKNNVKLSLKKSKIMIDNQTILEDVPNQALQYKFSSKCALEWILEFYKESKNQISDKSCDDPKIRKKFNTYKFADHKEHVIDLLRRVTTVSVETMRLRTELENMPWGKQPKLNLDKSKEEKTVSKASKKTKKSKKVAKKTRKKTKQATGMQETLDDNGQKRLL